MLGGTVGIDRVRNPLYLSARRYDRRRSKPVRHHLVRYHNLSCYHRIFVRQGYAPIRWPDRPNGTHST
ncbi:MAG: hypothetical protein ACLRMJ_13755 [Alistipes finegoldii]